MTSLYSRLLVGCEAQRGAFNIHLQDDEGRVEGRMGGKKQEGGRKEESVVSGEKLEIHDGRK